MTTIMEKIAMAAMEYGYVTKQAAPVTLLKEAFIGWGGRHKDYGDGGAKLSVGYSNLLGVVPYPLIGIRIGQKDNMGVTLGTALGISSRASDSYKNRSYVPGLLDLLINWTEDRKSAKEKSK